jgi:hypothetical protein
MCPKIATYISVINCLSDDCFLFLDFFAVSVDHLLTLFIGIGPVIYSLDRPDPQTESLLFCKIRGYIFQISLMVSRWLVAFACIDRYALTSEKVNLRNFAKTRIAYRIIIIIIIVWSIICTHRLIFYQIEENACGILTNTGAAIYQFLYVIIGGGILPTTTMIVCALLIRRNLANKQQRRIHIMNGYQRNTLDQQVLQLLFIQIICYIIFTIPQLANLVFNTISNTIPNRSEERLAVEQFITFIAELMLYMFPVTSFYLYTLTSRTFRKELTDLLHLHPLSRVFHRNARQIIPLPAIITVDYHRENQQTAISLSQRRP